MVFSEKLNKQVGRFKSHNYYISFVGTPCGTIITIFFWTPCILATFSSMMYCLTFKILLSSILSGFKQVKILADFQTRSFQRIGHFKTHNYYISFVGFLKMVHPVLLLLFHPWCTCGNDCLTFKGNRDHDMSKQTALKLLL